MQGFLGSSTVKAALNQTGSVLSAIQILKKICDHPALLNGRRALQAVRMPRRTDAQRVRRATAKAKRRPPAPPAVQRRPLVLDDSDSDDFGGAAGVDGGGREGRGSGDSLTQGKGFDVYVDGVRQRSSRDECVADAAAGSSVPAGLEDDVADDVPGRRGLEDSSSEDGGTVGGGGRGHGAARAGDSSDDGADSGDDGMSDFIVQDSDGGGSGDDSSGESDSGSEGEDDEGEEEAPEEWRGEGAAEEDAQRLMERLTNMQVGDSCKTVCCWTGASR